MAVRKLVINFGQSGAGPFSDLETWLPDRVDINPLFTPTRVAGAYAPDFAMPFNAPGYSGTRPVKGVAVRNIRYLTAYNPIVTGYTSYPGTGRVLNMVGLTASWNHTSTTVWVEQQFLRGTHQLTSITRKTTGLAHAVEAILEPIMSVGAFNDAPNSITITAHGLIDDDRLTLTGTLPTGYALATTYFVKKLDADTFQLALTAGGSAVTFTGTGGAAQVNVSFPTLAGSRLKFGTAAAWTTPGPQWEEEFAYAIKASAATVAAATVTLNIGFGKRRNTTASLKGLQIRQADGGGTRILDAWDNSTRTATVVDSTTLLASTWDVTAGETLIIEPQGGVAWDRYVKWLPWSMFESNLSAATVEKTNPYLPGFDYPNHIHTPAIYGTDTQTPTAVEGSGGFFNLTVSPYIAWHVGFLVRLSEFYGEEVWCISTDFGGTSASHNEAEIGTPNCAWYDKGQQTDWSAGRSNSCFQRWLDELDAGIAAAAAVGDTLQVVGIFRNQGFADATSSSDPTYGDSASQSGISADKFYETNKAFRAKCRAALVARGLWDGAAAEIPWVQPLEQQESADLSTIGDADLLQQVTYAMHRLADEDDYADTYDQTGLLTWDTIHLFGSELAKAEDLAMQAFVRILRRTDRSGEVAMCNAALAMIGEDAGAITSLNTAVDTSAEAARCATFYPKALRWALEERFWSFAMLRKALLAVTSDSSVYQFAYVFPSDCVRPLSLIPAETPDDILVAGFTFPTPWPTTVMADWQRYTSAEVPQMFSHERKADGTDVVYTNLEGAHLRYIGHIRDVALFPEHFRDAVQMRLASYLAGATVKGIKGAQLAQSMWAAAKAAIGGAAELDGQNSRVRPKHVPIWFQQ